MALVDFNGTRQYVNDPDNSSPNFAGVGGGILHISLNLSYVFLYFSVLFFVFLCPDLDSLG